jgi:hypothetical protein
MYHGPGFTGGGVAGVLAIMNNNAVSGYLGTSVRASREMPVGNYEDEQCRGSETVSWVDLVLGRVDYWSIRLRRGA